MPVIERVLDRIAYDYDSDSDDEFVNRKIIGRGTFSASTDSLLSECPTAEHLPSLISSARSKEVVVVEPEGAEVPLPTAADEAVADPECDETLAALVEEALPPRPANTEISSDVARAPAPSSSETSSSSRKRATRAVRGRSGRRHRRESGVSGRALRLIEAAQLGPWPSSTFSKLCNVLKDAPPPPVLVRLTLRRAWSRPSLQLKLQWHTGPTDGRRDGHTDGRKDGGATLEQHEVFADRPDDAAALLSEIALQPLDGASEAAADDETDADADTEDAMGGSLNRWPWSLVVAI